MFRNWTIAVDTDGELRLLNGEGKKCKTTSMERLIQEFEKDSDAIDLLQQLIAIRDNIDEKICGLISK